jgi:hypothetical protein
MSNNLSWPKKTFAWPNNLVLKFDINKDGINEYHMKSWYAKYHSIQFSLWENWKVKWNTLFDTNYNYDWWWDWYQSTYFNIWSIGWKHVVQAWWSLWWSSMQIYSFESLSESQPFVMKNKYKIPNMWVTWYDTTWQFYDIDNDWNDEVINYFNRINNEYWLVKNTIRCSGLDNDWNFVTYWSYVSDDYNKTFSTPFFLKNLDNLSDSYVIFQWHDRNDWIYKHLWMKSKWNTSSWYINNYSNINNYEFNWELWFTYNWVYWNIVWLFNNWEKDYVVLRQWSNYKFYNFTW